MSELKSFQRKQLLLFLAGFLIILFDQGIIYDHFIELPLVFLLYLLRMLFWVIVFIFTAFSLEADHERDYIFIPNFLGLIWILFIIPALACTFISIPLMVNIFDPDISIFERLLSLKYETIRGIISLFTYTIATGAGLVSGIKEIAYPLHKIGFPYSKTIFLLTTILDFGTKIMSNIIVIQILSLIEPFSLVYVGVWNIVSLIQSHGKFHQKKILIWGGLLAYFIIIGVAIFRFFQLPEDFYDLIIEFLKEYLVFTINTTIITILIKYITSTLTCAMLVTKFISYEETYIPFRN